MNWLRAVKRSMVILVIYGIGLVNAYYLPRYGIEWLLGPRSNRIPSRLLDPNPLGLLGELSGYSKDEPA